MADADRSVNMARRAFFLVLFSTCATSTSSLFIRFSTCPSMVLVAYRNVIAALLLLPLILTKYRREMASLDRKTVLVSMAAGICFAVHLTLYFTAIHNTTIAATLVLTGMEVIVVALFLFFTGQERYSAAGWAGIMITLAGGVLVSAAGGGEGSMTLFGNLMAAASSLFIAAWTLISNRVRKKISNIPHVFIAFLTAGVFLCLFVPAGGTPLFGYGSINYLCAFMMAIVSSLLSHAVFTWSFKYISPTLVSLMKLSTPVWGALWAVLLFAEVPLWNQAVGGIIVTAGIVLYLRKKNKQ